MLLHDLLAQYICARLDLSAGHIGQLRATVRTFGRWLGREPSVEDLTETTILGCLRWYRGLWAAASTNSRRADLLALWRFAWRRGLTEADPTRADVPRVREPKRLPEAWTRDEVRLLVAHARTLPGSVGNIAANAWWSSLLLACWDTSSRVSAILSSRSTSVNIADGYLVLRGESTKDKTERLYWLSDETVAAIAGHWCPHRELVWPWPFCRRHLWTVFRRDLVEPLGLAADKRGMSLFHKLRRSTLSAEAAESLEAARRRAGHSRPEVTLAHYVDPRVGGAKHLPPALDGGNGRFPCGRRVCCCANQ